MSRWWLALALVTASAVAVAQPAPATDRAIQAATAAEQQVQRLGQERAELNARYQDELTDIDRLKKERASWRRDRELRDDLASSNDTASQLATLDKQRAAAQDAATAARKAAVAAIDAELAGGASGDRAARLRALRARIAPPTRAPAAIHLPSTDVDPVADAGELDQQAAQIRATEQELENQAIGLDREAQELEETAAVRKHNQRANRLAMSDDDQPLHGAQHSATTTTGGGNDTLSPGTQAGGAGGGGAGSGSGAGAPPPHEGGMGAGGDTFAGGDRGPTSGFESDVTIVLGDVIDHATIEDLARASRSGDPAQRAEAARRARDAVRAKLDQLRKQRALIEARAKALRK